MTIIQRPEFILNLENIFILNEVDDKVTLHVLTAEGLIKRSFDYTLADLLSYAQVNANPNPTMVYIEGYLITPLSNIILIKDTGVGIEIFFTNKGNPMPLPFKITDIKLMNFN